jgi:2-C-methyl-D-erythritol 2,4-cyclodiphosphate synthase
MTIDANSLRIGLGTDLHVLEPGRPCILGGVHHDCPVGPKSWSDGDPVLHALADALLGAGGLPDLGTLFPDHDPEWRDADSSVFVVRAVAMLAERRLRPLSCDVVVACERPRIAPARDRIRARLADLLGLPIDRVNVKGKSLEGTAGSVESVATTCVVLVGELRSAGD